MRKFLTLLTAALLVLVGGFTFASTASATNPDNNGTCPEGYTNINFSGSLSWMADADYSSVILVGGPPGGQNQDPDGRDKYFSDVSEGDVIARVAHEISHICVVPAPVEPEITTETVYELDCDYLLTTTVITYTDGEETGRETSTSTIDAEAAAELGLTLPYECEVPVPVVTTETVYELDCDYLLTTTVITYTDGEETDREQSTSTIDAETAAELGLTLPYECEVPVPVVTTETEYMLDCDYLLTTTVRTYTDEVLTDTEVTTETITAEAAAELGLALPTDCELPTVVVTPPTVVVTPPTVVVNPPAVVVTPAAPARPARAMPTFTG